MSDWYGSARSNYFKVKDVDAFKEFLSKWGGKFIEQDKEVLTDNCRLCKAGKVDMKCENYLKATVGECNGIKVKSELVGFLGEDDHGALPHYYSDENTGIDYGFEDFLKELSTHLVNGFVAVMMEAGAEKLKYITGAAWAINSKGETKIIDINQIYDEAKALGPTIMQCEY